MLPAAWWVTSIDSEESRGPGPYWCGFVVGVAVVVVLWVFAFGSIVVARRDEEGEQETQGGS